MEKRYTCLICRREISHPAAECPYCKARSVIAEGASPRILVMVFGVMVAVFAFTALYASSFKQVRSERGRLHFEAAEALLAEGQHLNSIGEYRDALVYAKDEPSYRLGLARALFEADRYSEAENYLVELRGSDPASGIVNYLLGRLAARDGRIDEAVSYYRTAIYGTWGDAAETKRLEMRLELVQILEEAGREQQLTAELLDLTEIMPDDRAIQHRVASLMLRVRVYDRASSMFQTLLASDQQDRVALLGRAEAEYQLGNYLTARTHYNRALLLHEDDATAERVALCNRIIELDPTRRGIGLSERFRRSRVLIERARAVALACQNPGGSDFVGPLPAMPEALVAALDAADEELTKRRRASDDSVEANTLLAEEIWNQARPTCAASAPPPDPPLQHVMAKLSR